MVWKFDTKYIYSELLWLFTYNAPVYVFCVLTLCRFFQLVDNIHISQNRFATMSVKLLQICCLVQFSRSVFGSKLQVSGSGLISMPRVGSTITVADFSKNLIKAVRVSSLLEARNLEVRVTRSLISVGRTKNMYILPSLGYTTGVHIFMLI